MEKNLFKCGNVEKNLLDMIHVEKNLFKCDACGKRMTDEVQLSCQCGASSLPNLTVARYPTSHTCIACIVYIVYLRGCFVFLSSTLSSDILILVILQSFTIFNQYAKHLF